MVTSPSDIHPPEPAWRIALLFPAQGEWTPGDYFALTHSANRLVELNDGNIEVLEMPTESHQFIVRFLFRALDAFVVSGSLGEVVFAPIRVRTIADRYREPDLAFMLNVNASRRGERFWTGADIVMEVVSDDPESRDRDLRQKRDEYAAAGIPEYWIVDCQSKRIIVFRLDEERYAEHGVFAAGPEATSVLLSGFGVNVASVFSAADDARG